MQLPVDIYSVDQIRQLEAISQKELGISETTLMQCAGAAAYGVLREEWPEAKRIAVLCGTGNNGGDGYVLARLAFAHDLDVVVYQVGEADHLEGVALEAAQQCYNAEVPVKEFEQFDGQHVDIIVDAVLGIGVKGEVTGPHRIAIEKMNTALVPVLSVDVPSGLDADTGCYLGDVVCADATVTFIGLKQGLLTHYGVDCCGELFCDSLQIPTMIFDHVIPEVQRISFDQYRFLFLPRNNNTHKGDFGHVLVVGGSAGMSGAVRIAAAGAMRSGAGLVSVAYQDQPGNVLDNRRPEVMAHAVATADDLAPLLEMADVVVIGPGLGKSDWSHKMLNAVLASDKVKVIDADALNLLAEVPVALGDNTVITPHPGEAARLLGVATEVVQQNRFKAAEKLFEKYQVPCVLKGAGSLVVDKQGVQYLCHAGNPGMASAGMGDLLSGLVGSFIAQHFEKDLALKMAVTLHAGAGDMTAKELGQRGLLALDLLPAIRHLVNPS